MNISAGQTKVWLWDIYVAGSCLGGRGPGGYGFYATCRRAERKISGGEATTTNMRMELMAAIVAIENFPAGSNLRLHSDNEYVANGVNHHMANWKQRGWVKSDGEELLNQDLWQRLDAALQQRAVELHLRRKGEYGEYGRKIARALAKEEAQRRKPNR